MPSFQHRSFCSIHRPCITKTCVLIMQDRWVFEFSNYCSRLCNYTKVCGTTVGLLKPMREKHRAGQMNVCQRVFRKVQELAVKLMEGRTENCNEKSIVTLLLLNSSQLFVVGVENFQNSRTSQNFRNLGFHLSFPYHYLARCIWWLHKFIHLI